MNEQLEFLFIFIIYNQIVECYDDSPHCAYWQQYWGCNYGSVGTYCKKTCNLCGGDQGR